jgi:hypothetical protein
MARTVSGLARCSRYLTVGQELSWFLRFFLSHLMAFGLQGRRTLPAYFKDKLVDHLSALKVNGEQ